MKGLNQSNLEILKLMGSKGKPQEMTKAQEEVCQAILLASYNNLAVCHLKNENWTRALENASEVLKIEPGNAKALFRRGQAYLGQNELYKAKKDFTEALRLTPGGLVSFQSSYSPSLSLFLLLQTLLRAVVFCFCLFDVADPKIRQDIANIDKLLSKYDDREKRAYEKMFE